MFLPELTRLRLKLHVLERQALEGSTDNTALSENAGRTVSVAGARDRPWHLRAWSGISARGWWRTLARHRFHVSPMRLPMAIILSGISLVNSIMASFQWLLFRKPIEATEIVAEPIFVIGHWRAGTTLLHELLVLDPDFTFPNTYACFCPNHFLVSESWLKRLIGAFLPKQRPMDNMSIGWDLPQEDEWALCNMGLRSPYFKIMFPNMPVQDRQYSTLHDLSPEEKTHWQRRFTWFLKALTVRQAKRIVLKTPVHTSRVAALLDIFPSARFIHITRNPFAVFPSTVHTWQRMYRYHGLQIPKFTHLEQEVHETFEEMYRAFDSDRPKLSDEQYYQLSYEALAANPKGEMEKIYQHYNLPLDDERRSRWASYAAKSSGYKTNRYQLDAEQRAEIARRWDAYFQNYGYDKGDH